MPFKTYGELIDLSAKDPVMAKKFVSQAKDSNMPVVSPNNPGYQNAIKRRLKKSSMSPDTTTQNDSEY
jgi:hypothetical protein